MVVWPMFLPTWLPNYLVPLPCEQTAVADSCQPADKRAAYHGGTQPTHPGITSLAC